MGLDPTKPVQTRDGKPARIICTDAKLRNGVTHIGLVMVKDGRETAYEYHADGRYAHDASNLDLINVPQKHKRWVNCYLDEEGFAYPSREEADRMASSNRIACIEIEFTEGEGLS